MDSTREEITFFGILLASLNKSSSKRLKKDRNQIQKFVKAERKGLIMSYYYLIKSMTEDGFGELRFVDNGRESRISQVKKSDVEAIERLLDVRPGTLSASAYFFESDACKCACQKKITMYDFVFTSLVDSAYSKTLVLHTLFSTNAPKKSLEIRCSSCGRTGMYMSKYKTSHYGYYDTAA